MFQLSGFYCRHWGFEFPKRISVATRGGGIVSTYRHNPERRPETAAFVGFRGLGFRVLVADSWMLEACGLPVMLIMGKFSMMVVIMAIKMRTVLLMRMLLAADDDKVAGDGDGNDDGDADDDEDVDAADGRDLGNVGGQWWRRYWSR